ncbi:MAG: ABC transporter permease [Actinobacteria bacterium]|nr:ABC transporter permease [Actinomycetota bacterium]
MKGVLISLALVGLAMAISRRQMLRLEKELAVATVRALVQLALLASVITVVFSHFGFASILLVGMFGAACWTASRRLGGIPGAARIAAMSIAVASAISIGVLFGFGAFDFTARNLIPISGMLFANSMTAASLTGGRLRDDLVDKVMEVEARLALGVHTSEALRPYKRRAAISGLIPIIDATKNVGLVGVPGAFVGMVLGGASPRRAAEIQLVVLFMLLGAAAVTGITATFLVGKAFVGPGERVILPPPLAANE